MKLPLIAVVGPSGSGKSSSLRNLPPKNTKILNIDEKILPFPNASDFNEIRLSSINDFNEALDKAIVDNDIKIIVIETFTFFSDKLLQKSKSINKGYEIYNYYADQMIVFLNKLKSIENKWV